MPSGVGHRPAAQQAVGVGDAPGSPAGRRPEHAAVEERGLVEVVPGLGERHVVDVGDRRPGGRFRGGP